MHYPFMCQNICYGAQCIFGIPWEGYCHVAQWRYCSVTQWRYYSLAHEGIAFLLSFGRVMQYPSNCWKIWYGAQTISGVLRMGYCTFIEYFTLWTWVQHALNVSKLNYSFISLWLSTWFAIRIYRVLNILIVPLFICLNEQEQVPCNTFILFFPHRCRLLGVYCSGNYVSRCSHVGGVW
jgi:hypothetical protein